MERNELSAPANAESRRVEAPVRKGIGSWEDIVMTRENATETMAPADGGAVVLVAFSLDGRRFAVPLNSVIRVERVAAVTPLPQAPEIVCGIVNFHDEVIPVVDVRRRFGFPPRFVELSDQFLLLKTWRRSIAFLVDNVEGMLDVPEQRLIGAETVLSGLEHIRGILRLEDGMVLIHDPETFLSLEEERTLEEALKEPAREKGHPVA
jgi:purine-binding chemotaxis protein CheW